MKRKYLILLLFAMCFSVSLQGQESRTNLEVLFALADSSMAEMFAMSPESGDSIRVSANLAGDYSLFRNRLLYNEGNLIFSMPEEAEYIYTIHNAGVFYSDTFKESFFGDWYAAREIRFSGNYIVPALGSRYHEFTYVYTDTVLYDEIEFLESSGIPFTTGTLPSEPVFSGLLEPVIIAVSSAAAIILFFTIRSQ
jgi:hypothetical protein